MTNEELVKLYQEGDKQALDTLIEKNKGMVFKLVNNTRIYDTNSIDKEDLEQEGFIGLMNAARKYNCSPLNEAKFINYAHFWIRGEISRYLKQKNTNGEKSLDAPIWHDETARLLDFLEDKKNQFINVEDQSGNLRLRDELERVMCSYTTLREREVIKLRYGWDNDITMTFKEISEILEIYPGVVQRAEARGFKKIRNCPWGKAKALELYKQKKSESEESIIGTLESISFAQKYLYDEVM